MVSDYVQHINLSLWSQGINVSNNPKSSHSTQHITITLCNGTSLINMGNLLF